VLADGKIYITSEDGVATVYRAGPKFEILAENKMDDYTLSSMAVKDGQIFLRTAGWLWAIGAKGGVRSAVRRGVHSPPPSAVGLRPTSVRTACIANRRLGAARGPSPQSSTCDRADMSG
jgi:hypothetical protein